MAYKSDSQKLYAALEKYVFELQEPARGAKAPCRPLGGALSVPASLRSLIPSTQAAKEQGNLNSYDRNMSFIPCKLPICNHKNVF